MDLAQAEGDGSDQVQNQVRPERKVLLNVAGFHRIRRQVQDGEDTDNHKGPVRQAVVGDASQPNKQDV